MTNKKKKSSRRSTSTLQYVLKHKQSCMYLTRAAGCISLSLSLADAARFGTEVEASRFLDDSLCGKSLALFEVQKLPDPEGCSNGKVSSSHAVRSSENTS